MTWSGRTHLRWSCCWHEVPSLRVSDDPARAFGCSG
jgi:hypothetical protein